MKYRFFTRKSPISPFAIVSLAVFVISLITLAVSEYSVAAADAVNGSVSFLYRRLMAGFAEVFPFSVFEALVISSPLLIALVIIFAVRAFRRGEGRAARFLVNLFAVVLLVYSAFAVSSGVPYNTTPLQEKMGIPDVEVNSESLAEVMTSLRDEVNALVPEISYEGGASVSGRSPRELSKEICKSFAENKEFMSLSGEFSSTAKPIYFGNVMSYFSLTGIYTFYTGEANYNTAYPDFDVAFTAAHELAHQRGIIRENEANFAAYLVLSRSDDVYLRYAAALSMYEYIGNALYKTDKELYRSVHSGLSEKAYGDLLSSYAVTEKYGNTFISRLSRKMNDLYLKSNGTEGVVSYSRVVESTVAYYEYLKTQK